MFVVLLSLCCRAACTWRYFGEGNTTQLNGIWGYAAESLLHEVREQEECSQWRYVLRGVEGG